MTPEQLTALLPGADVQEEYGRLTAEVSRGQWGASAAALQGAGLDCFDLLTAVDEQDAGIEVVLHLCTAPARISVLLRTRCPAGDPHLDSLTGVFAGAAWHERETAEMFGLVFDGHPGLVPLLLPTGFSGAPLRKEFVLAARVAVAWPGAPEPGQSSAEAATGRRKVLPPGVPKPGTWPPPVPPRTSRGERA